MANDKANPFPKVFKAIASLASRDETRPHIRCVRAPDAVTLVATDGHALIRVVFDAPHGMAFPASYDAASTSKLLAAGVSHSAVAPILKPMDYPEYVRVIPAFTSDGSAARFIGQDASLMASVLDAMDAIARAYGNRNEAVRLQPGQDEHLPMRVDMALPGTLRATAVIMSMRIAADSFQGNASLPAGRMYSDKQESGADSSAA